MRKALKWVVAEAKSPEVRPIEIWLFRIAVAYISVKLGITVEHKATG